MFIASALLGETIRETVDRLLTQDHKASPNAVLYAEKLGGFQCRTCRYSVPRNATHGRCAVVSVMISLDTGCCVAWTADPRQLHSYQEKEAS